MRHQAERFLWPAWVVDTPSNRELPVDLRARAMALVRERYADFGPTLACEKQAECHGAVLTKETVRRWMRDARLWIP